MENIMVTIEHIILLVKNIQLSFKQFHNFPDLLRQPHPTPSNLKKSLEIMPFHISHISFWQYLANHTL